MSQGCMLGTACTHHCCLLLPEVVQGRSGLLLTLQASFLVPCCLSMTYQNNLTRGFHHGSCLASPLQEAGKGARSA
jgi:hypothetical protein